MTHTLTQIIVVLFDRTIHAEGNMFTETGHDTGNSQPRRSSTNSDGSDDSATAGPLAYLIGYLDDDDVSEDLMKTPEEKEEKNRSEAEVAAATHAPAAAAAAKISSDKGGDGLFLQHDFVRTKEEENEEEEAKEAADAMGAKLDENKCPEADAASVDDDAKSNSDEDFEQLHRTLNSVLDSSEVEADEKKEEGDVAVSEKKEQDDNCGEMESADDGNTWEESHESGESKGKGDTGGSTESDFAKHLDKMVELGSLLHALKTLSTPGKYPANQSLVVEIERLVVKTGKSFAAMIVAVCDDHQNMMKQNSLSVRAAAQKIVTEIELNLGVSAGARGSDEVVDDANDALKLNRQVSILIYTVFCCC